MFKFKFRVFRLTVTVTQAGKSLSSREPEWEGRETQPHVRRCRGINNRDGFQSASRQRKAGSRDSESDWQSLTVGRPGDRATVTRDGGRGGLSPTRSQRLDLNSVFTDALSPAGKATSPRIREMVSL